MMPKVNTKTYKMKRAFFFISLLFVALALLVSCQSRKPVEPVVLTNTREVVQTIRDTVFQVEADSSSYKALIECINGKPVIQQNTIKTTPGKVVKAPKVSLKNNELHVDCEKEAQSLFHQWKDIYIKDHEQTPIYIPQPVEVEKPLTFWQRTQIIFGRILMGILFICCLIGVLRWKRLI